MNILSTVSQGGVNGPLLSGYQFTSDKWKTVGRKQLHCHKIERLDFQYKLAVCGLTYLQSWPEGLGNKLYGSSRVRNIRPRAFNKNESTFFSRQTTWYNADRRNVLYMHDVGGIRNTRAMYAASLISPSHPRIADVDDLTVFCSREVMKTLYKKQFNWAETRVELKSDYIYVSFETLVLACNVPCLRKNSQ